MDEAFRILDDGRVFFDYGPASMVVTARRGDENLSDLAASAFPFLRDSLSEIAGALPILRQYPDGMDYSELTGLPRVMAESVLATGEPTLTPMAAWALAPRCSAQTGISACSTPISPTYTLTNTAEPIDSAASASCA